jgi:hypothetical protein
VRRRRRDGPRPVPQSRRLRSSPHRHRRRNRMRANMRSRWSREPRTEPFRPAHRHASSPSYAALRALEERYVQHRAESSLARALRRCLLFRRNGRVGEAVRVVDLRVGRPHVTRLEGGEVSTRRGREAVDQARRANAVGVGVVRERCPGQRRAQALGVEFRPGAEQQRIARRRPRGAGPPGVRESTDTGSSTPYPCAKTSPRRASARYSTGEPGCAARNASSDITPCSGRAVANARPLSVAREMRSPVKLPGPRPTTNASISVGFRPASARTSAMVSSTVEP